MYVDRVEYFASNLLKLKNYAFKCHLKRIQEINNLKKEEDL